jgi:hypothetical protein
MPCRPAFADFSGYYAPSNWNLNLIHDLDPTSNASKVALASDLAGPTIMVITAQNAGTVQFDWTYKSRGSNGAGYVVNNNQTTFSNPNSLGFQSGHASFKVNANDSFGFFIGANSPLNAPSPSNPPGILTITNFSAPPGTVIPPTPDCNGPLTVAPTINQVTAGIAQATVAFTYSGPCTGLSYTATANPGNLTATNSQSPIVVTGLTPGQTYTFTLTATNPSGWGIVSNPSAPIQILSVPAQPTLEYRPQDTPQVLRICESDAGGSPLLSYSLQLGSGNPVTGKWTGQGCLDYPVTALTKGLSYPATVTVTNAQGSSAPSAVLNFVPIMRPNTPALKKPAVVIGNQSATIYFSENVTAAAPVDSYIVLLNPATPNSRTYTFPASAATTGATLTGLANGTNYTAMVKAVNAVTSSIGSTVISFTPATTPTAPTLTYLPWARPQAIQVCANNGGSPLTAYALTIGSSSPGTGSWSGQNCQNVPIGNLINGQSYSATATVSNAQGAGPASAPLAFTPITIPSQPRPGRVQVGNGSATINFSQPVSAAAPVDRIMVIVNPWQPKQGFYFSKQPGGQQVNLTAVPANGVVISGLINGSPYKAAIRAYNAAGKSLISAVIGPFTPITSPAAPVITVTGGDGTAEVKICAAGDGGSPITDYTVQLTPTTTTAGLKPIVAASSWQGAACQTVTVNDVVNFVPYLVTASLSSALGGWSESTPQNLTTRGGPPAPKVSVTNLSTTSATIVVQDVIIPEQPPITGHTANMSPGNTVFQRADFTQGTVPGNPAKPASLLQLTSLSASTKYTLWVPAYNQLGTGQPAVFSFSTLGAPTPVGAGSLSNGSNVPRQITYSSISFHKFDANGSDISQYDIYLPYAGPSGHGADGRKLRPPYYNYTPYQQPDILELRISSQYNPLLPYCYAVVTATNEYGVSPGQLIIANTPGSGCRTHYPLPNNEFPTANYR